MVVLFAQAAAALTPTAPAIAQARVSIQMEPVGVNYCALNGTVI